MALTQEDFEKLSEYLDLQDVESFDDAKTKFDEVYARKATYEQSLINDKSFVDKIIGKKLGKYENELKTFAKEGFGVEFEKDDLKGGQDYEAVSKVVFDKIKQKHTDSIKEMESKIGADPSELVKEWETKLETERREKKKWKTEFETLGQNFETYKTDLQVNMRKEKLNKNVDDMFSKIPFADEALKDELKIAGFKTKILSDVQFDLDENDNYILLGKDKLPITNPAKAGATYSPEDYVKEQAIKFGIYKLSDKGGQQATQQAYQPKIETPGVTQTLRKPHPSALQAQG